MELSELTPGTVVRWTKGKHKVGLRMIVTKVSATTVSLYAYGGKDRNSSARDKITAQIGTVLQNAEAIGRDKKFKSS